MMFYVINYKKLRLKIPFGAKNFKFSFIISSFITLKFKSNIELKYL